MLEARKLETRQVALDAEHAHKPHHHAGDRSFAHSDTIFRDSFRKRGAFDFSGQPPIDPAQFHARATCSGVSTRSAYLSDRQTRRREVSLAFEPHEVERLRDIPKAEQLREWWRQPRDGYVADPASSVCANSLRLELAHHGFELGPIDPGKVRCPASVDERRQLQMRKAQLADKVPHILHSIPAAYLKSDRAETATITRAPDLYAQERQHVRPLVVDVRGYDGERWRSVGAQWADMCVVWFCLASQSSTGGGGALTRAGSLSSAFPPVSPINALNSQPKKRRARPKSLSIESLFVESTSQRALLDQLKTCESLASPERHRLSSGVGFGHSVDHQQQQDVGSSSPTRGVRCGGFA